MYQITKLLDLGYWNKDVLDLNIKIIGVLNFQIVQLLQI